VLERALAEEMTGHLGYERHDPAGRGSGNSARARPARPFGNYCPELEAGSDVAVCGGVVGGGLEGGGLEGGGLEGGGLEGGGLEGGGVVGGGVVGGGVVGG
jgi:hypothetical protein